MKKQDVLKIKDALSTLFGQPIRNLTRGEGIYHVGIAELDFGDSGTLHIMCSMRFVCNGEMIFTSEDIFHPNTALESTLLRDDGHFDWDNFDYNPYGNSFYDEMSEKYFSSDVDGNIVKDIHVSKFADIIFTFENGNTLEIINDSSGYSECWRFSTSHLPNTTLIVTSNGIVNMQYRKAIGHFSL